MTGETASELASEPLTLSIDEWFVVALARTVRDQEVVFHGFASPCAQVAMHVARRTHAPDCLLVEGATYAVNPDPVFIPPTSNDLALHQGAVYRMKFEEFFDAACRGDVDRMFLSGGQIDGHGNTNVTAIGPDPTRPKIKLGGGGGGCNISATIGALTVWTTRHRSGRTLVRDLDVLTDIGHLTPEGTRAELGYPGRRTAVARHRAGPVRLPGRARAAARGLARRHGGRRRGTPPASTCASTWARTTACSRRRPRRSWPRCAPSTRSASGASSSAPKS